MDIELVAGDITTMHVDAVVNAAGPEMRGGGGVDGAIHRAAGPTVLAECVARFPDGLPTGGAGWTPAGDLPAQYVIHVVGPDRRAGQDDPGLLRSCYAEALRVADELAAATMAFPLVSAGVYGWPIDDAARIAVETLARTPTSVRTATMVAYNAAAHDALQTALVRSGRLG